MAQYVEVEGVGTVEFPDGMSRDDMAAALKQLPTPKAEPKPEPKKAEKPRQDFATTSPMGEDLGSAIMSQAGEGLGVMSGKTPAAPVQTPSKAPLRPEVRAAIEAEYDAASPKKRANMEKAPGAVGDVIRQRAQEYKRAERTPEAAARLSPAAEERTQRLIQQGEKPEFARAAAQRAAEMGVVPGKEVQAIQAEGALEPTKFDFDIYNQYKNANPVLRGAMAGWQGYKQGALGINQAVADLLNADEFATRFGERAAEARNVVQSMGENPVYAGRMFEGAINSIAQQLPALVGGVATGSEGLVLASMFAQSFGQEYAEGTAKGLGGATAATRAGLYAAFEVVGEKFGLKFQMDKIRQATQGMSNDVLKGWLGNTLKRELPGEILTTTGQFLTDLSSVGLSPNATFGDYLQQVGDTTVQTLMQSGLMAGGSKVLSKGIEKIQEARPDFALADAIQQDVNSYLQSDRPRLTALEEARRVELEGEPARPPLTALEAARRPELEIEPTDPRVQALAQSYQEQGMPPEQAQTQAQTDIQALQPPVTEAEGRVIQRKSAEDEARTMAGRAERAALQMEGDNVPTTEPPPFVTEPSTDERGIFVPSAEAGAAELPTTPIDRGLGAASSAVRQLAGREELERAALVEQQELAERAISRGFAREPYPDLGLTLGASWVRDTLATNPTPEAYQEAAYARLEELGGLPPRDARPAFERRAPAAPMVGERPEERVEPAVEAAPTEAVEAPVVPKAVQPVKEKPVEAWFEGVEKVAVTPRKGKNKLVQMPIDEFLKLAERDVPGSRPDKEARVQKIISEDGKFSGVPYLYIEVGSEGSAKVTGHEGRHRARALKALGYTTIPVELRSNIRWSEQQDPESPDYKQNWPTTLVGETGDIVPFPVPREKTYPTTKEEPRGPEAPKAVKAKEERPAQPTEAAAPLELEAGRKEELEVDPSILDTVARTSPEKLKQQLIAEFGATAAGEPRRRAPGGGREVSEAAKTGAERVEQAADVINLTRDTLAEISAVRKLERSTTGDFFGIAARTAEEKAYREALRDLSIETLRAELYKKAQKFKSRPIVAYAQAGKYIKSLKPAEQERAKALAEKREDYTTLPPLPTTLSSPAQRKKAIEKIRAAEEEVVAEPVKKARPAKETEVKEELKPVLRPVTEAFGTPLWLAEYQGLWEEKGKAAREKEKAPEEKTRWTDYNAQLLRSSMSKADRAATMLEEEPVGDAQEELQDAAIHDQLDDEDKAVIAEHYGETSYNEVAKRKFVEDVVKAMNEGLDAVSRVLHDIIKRLQAGMLAAIMVVNTSFITPTIPVATPTTLSRTVQVRATVPADVVGMSEGGRQAYATIYPAVEKGLKATNKLFIITDKPSANLYVFNPDGSLLTQSKVLLGKTMGDFYRGNTEVVQNRITPAGLFNLGLRDAARGGSEAKTAGAYDYGKVFVLDKAIDGEYSVTLFHSVWTKEKDAKQRLAALEKPGPLDSRYSFGCINVPKGVYGNLLAGHENQIDGAKMFVVPENPAHTMDFINGKAAVAEDIVRQQVAPVTKTVTEKVPPTAPKEERKEEVAAIREEKPVERRGMRALPARRRKGPEYLAEQQLDMEPDLGFYDVDTIAGALIQIAQSPNELEAMLAARLLQRDNAPTLRNVNFVVVDRDTKLKDKTAKQMLNKGTVGMFSPTTVGGTVYVRGDSYENQGINNEIVLHEAMHVSGSKKIDFVLAARSNGMEVEANLVEAVNALEDLMVRAKAAYDSKKSVNAELKFAAEADAFTDIQEFYAYGMTNAAMKQFLLNEVKGVSEKKSGFDIFIDALLKLFGIDPKLKSGLKDLVLISHEIMKAEQPSIEQMEAAFGEDITKSILEAKRQVKNVNTAIRDLKASQDARQVIQRIGPVQSAGRTPKALGDYVSAAFPNLDMAFLKSFIKVAPTSVLYRIGIANGIQSLKDARDNTRKMGTFRVNAMNAMTAIATEWAKLGRKEKDALADIMNLSTDIQVDPSVNTTVPELNRMWNALNPKQQKLYKNARDFYKQSYQLFLTTLKQKIATSNLAGSINDPTTPKGKLWEDLKTTYERNMGKGPYFPLMRHGEFWAQFGKGKDVNFQMFDSAKQRDKFIKQQIKERNKRGDKRTYEELVIAKEAAKGNEAEVLRKKIAKENIALRNIFSKIDAVALGSTAAVDQLKNDIFQSMLLVLPENSMRKMFITRKARAGYSRDALRNFISTGTRMANQLAKMRYLQQVNNNFDAAQENIRDNPKRDRLELLINELERRTNGSYAQPQEPGMLDKVVNAATKFTFMYLLTDMRAVFNNVWGVPGKSFPTLIKYFGPVAATKELTKLLAAMPAQVGVKRVDSAGNVKYTFPSFGSSLVTRSPKAAQLLTGLTPAELQFAVRQMDLRQISDQSTQTADLYFGNKAKTMSTPEVVLDTMVRVSGSLHQGSERIAREITFLTAYKLSRQKGMSPMEAVDNAQNITEEALYRYLPDESPPFLNQPIARLAFQFKKYSLYTTFYYYMNFKEMTGSLPSDVRKGAAYAFFGSMMMGALGAGVAGAFGVSTMMWMFGVLQAAINNLYEDDPEAVDISQLNIVRWFNNVWLPETFGDAKIPGTDVRIADALANGLLDAFTGINLSSGISEGGLWFRDLPNEFDMNALADFMTFNNIAPFAGLVNQMTAQAYREWSEGDTLKAMERWIPMKMLRSPAVAYRYSTEGVLDKDLDPIREAEEFTAGQLVMQGLGFKTSGLAEIQDLNAFLKKEERKIEDRKQAIVNAWVKAMRRGDEELIENASRRVYEFNLMYPREGWEITPDTLDDAFEGKLDKIKLRGRELTEENIAEEQLREKALQKILDEAKE